MMGVIVSTPLSKCDASLAVSFLKQLVQLEVLTEKEFKVIVKRIHAGATTAVIAKYLPKLDALDDAIRDM